MLGADEIQAIGEARKALDVDKYIRTLEQPLELNIFNQLNLEDYKVLNIRITNNDPSNAQNVILFGGAIGIEGANNGVSEYINIGNDIITGSTPSGVTVDSANNIWVVKTGDTSVSVFDSTGVLITTIGSVGFSPADIVYNTVLDRIYVSDAVLGSVIIINAQTMAIITTTAVTGVAPISMAVHTPTGNVFIVGATDVDVISPSNANIATIALPNGNAGLTGCVYNPTNNRIYATDETLGRIQIINPDTFAIDRELNMTGFVTASTALVFNPINDRIYVGGTQSIASVDLDDNIRTVLSTSPIPTESFLRAVFNPFNERIYFVAFGTTSVTTINANTEAVENSIPIGASPFGITFNNATNNMYVTNSTDSDMSVLSASVTVVGDEDYKGILQELTSNPIILKHIRYIADTPLQLANILSYNHQTPMGLVKQWSFQPQDYVSAQSQVNNISEIYEAEGRIIDNKGYFSTDIRPSESITLMFYYTKYAQVNLANLTESFSIERDLMYAKSLEAKEHKVSVAKELLKKKLLPQLN